MIQNHPPTFARIIPPMLVLLSLIFALPHAFAQRTKSSQKAGEQRKAEKGLRDNRYFFYFINPSITNFGTPSEKEAFSEAIRRDILAQLLYMRFMFYESYREIRHAQKIMIELYRGILTRDIRDGILFLNNFASIIVNTKNNAAKEYLRLGYRDFKSAETEFTMADNYNAKLFSLKLDKYVRAIKKAKRGKRYGFLSMLILLDEKAAWLRIKLAGDWKSTNVSGLPHMLVLRTDGTYLSYQSQNEKKLRGRYRFDFNTGEIIFETSSSVIARGKEITTTVDRQTSFKNNLNFVQKEHGYILEKRPGFTFERLPGKHGRDFTRHDIYALQQGIEDAKARLAALNFTGLEKRVLEIPPPEKGNQYRLIHHDNFYGWIGKNEDEPAKRKLSFFDTIWNNPELRKHLPGEFKKYGIK